MRIAAQTPTPARPEPHAPTPRSFSATRAFWCDLAWASHHFASLRGAVSRHDIVTARAQFAALRSVLSAHLDWESASLDEQTGWEPAGGRESLAWSMKTWHDALVKGLQELAELVATPSLEIPSARRALERAVDRFDELLAHYAHEAEPSFYRALDVRLSGLPVEALSRAHLSWRERMAVAYCP